MTNSPKETSSNNSLPEENIFAQENFADLFEEYEKDSQKLVEGTVVKGVIVGITDKGVAIDIGAKSKEMAKLTKETLLTCSLSA